MSIPRVEPIRLPEDRNPLKLEACRAYARMMNTLDFWVLAPWLADDFQYESQWVLAKITSKTDYEVYIIPKLQTIKREGCRVWAEIGCTDAFGAGPCVVLAQGSPDNLVATALITMRGEKVARIDMCCVPSPRECRRTGEFPV